MDARAVVTMRMRADELAVVRAAAEAEGVPPRTWLRRVALEAAAARDGRDRPRPRRERARRT